jgi:hypothetical protein
MPARPPVAPSPYPPPYPRPARLRAGDTNGAGPRRPSALSPGPGNGDASYETYEEYSLPYSYNDFNGADQHEFLNSVRRRNPLRRLFSRGNDMESAHTSHTYTAQGAHPLRAPCRRRRRRRRRQ